MKHEKIIRREDGSRVRIIAELNTYRGFCYDTYAHTCKKGKRTWVGTFNSDCYTYRKLSMDEKRKFRYESQFKVITKEERNQAVLELWEKLKPELL